MCDIIIWSPWQSSHDNPSYEFFRYTQTHMHTQLGTPDSAPSPPEGAVISFDSACEARIVGHGEGAPSRPGLCLVGGKQGPGKNTVLLS